MNFTKFYFCKFLLNLYHVPGEGIIREVYVNIFIKLHRHMSSETKQYVLCVNVKLKSLIILCIYVCLCHFVIKNVKLKSIKRLG